MALKTDRQKDSDAVTLYASKEEVDTSVAENDTKYFKIRFNFIDGHKGFRPGEFHFIFGTAGGGKTTIIRSLYADCAASHKVLLWLSEETDKDMKVNTARQGLSESIRKNISMISEETMDPKHLASVEAYKKYYEQQIMAIKPGIVIFDNLTTSVIYESLDPRQQSLFFVWLKKFHKRIGIPILAVGHTKSGVTDGQPNLIDLDDVRGSKTVSNGSPYVYILQRFKIAGLWFAFIRVRKSRHHEHEGFFHLTYVAEKKCYIGDAKVDFSFVKEKFLKREKL